MRYLGIDYGTKKIGLALSDEAGKMGFPHSVVQNDAQLLETLTALIEKERVGAIVVGESMDFSGKENAAGVAGRAFAQALAARTNIPLHHEPETFTTQAARRYPDGTRMKGSPDVDASAAALILTSYFGRTNPVNDDDHDNY
jgi:putative Holliday junction resolvase